MGVLRIRVGETPVEYADLAEVASKMRPVPLYLRVLDFEIYPDPDYAKNYAMMRDLIAKGFIASLARGTLVDADQYVLLLGRIVEAYRTELKRLGTKLD